ncbi:hypothetical protein SZ02_19285, partial [Vibrio parahaemolyticus]|uniref:hypothetical protein n=1 Tax=Vibrio parahaemolyticus TaxID=670 RepID=UPI0005C21DF3
MFSLYENEKTASNGGFSLWSKLDLFNIFYQYKGFHKQTIGPFIPTLRHQAKADHAYRRFFSKKKTKPNEHVEFFLIVQDSVRY